jgi:putative endonuclease
MPHRTGTSSSVTTALRRLVVDAIQGALRLRLTPGGNRLARHAFMLKRVVYVLKNTDVPPRYYTGVTSDVARRCVEHNAGNCTHTAKHRPWSVDVVVEFVDEQRAVAFERYLKSGSGVAFAQRHLR